jgi:outer membrane protein assembly factor BamB
LTGAFFNDSSPAIGGSTVVAGGTDGHLHAYNLSTGSALWTTTGADVATSGPSPVVSGADVYSPAGSTLKDVALSNGAIKHTSSTSCTGGVTTPAVAGGTVVFACTDSAGFEYLNALGGDLSFRNAVNFASSAAMSSPAIAGARVYALIAGSLISRSISLFSGAGDWTATPPFTVASDVAAGDGVVAVCGSGGLWVVHAADGSTAFSSPGSACSAAPTIANDVIYVPEQEAISVYDLYGDLLTVLGTDGSTGNVAVVDGTVIAAVAISGVSQYAIPNGNNVGSSARARARTRRPNPRSLRPDRRLRLQHHHRARGARS